MAVRVNKDAFNIREKLSELAVKFGLKGSELMRAETAQEVRDLVSAGRRNMVINGACQIHQRGGTSTTVDGSYPVDRFVTQATNLDEYAANISQSTESPGGFSNSLRIEGTTPETTIASGEHFRIQYRLEAQSLQHLGFGSSSAKSITISFWVRSSLPGAYAFHIYQPDTADIATSRYYINSADTWEYKTFTYSGNTGGAINNDNGQGLVLNWILDVNAAFTAESGLGANWDNYNGGSHFAAGHTANFCGSNNNFYLTGVQLEVGKNATEFEHRSYGEELALCQRYYIKIAPGNSNQDLGTGFMSTTTGALASIPFPTTMRTAPTVSGFDAPSSGLDFMIGYQNTSINVTGLSYSGASPTMGRVIGTLATSGTVGNGISLRTRDVSAYVAFSAEL